MSAADRPFRCSDAADLRGDPAHASAAPARRWLLVEVPGPWGPDAVMESPLDVDVARALSRLAAESGMRLTLIRRPGRSPETAVRHWAVADCDPGQEAISWGTYGRDEELLSVPLDPHRDPSPEPAYLVCTHGRHDQCCAIRGRPVATAMAALRPGQVWECSHVGGDRFAANVVVLPHGLYYGRVTLAAGVDVVSSYEAGEVLPDLLRGRSSLPDAAQAAQHFARLELGERRLDALEPLSVRPAGAAGVWDVELASRRGPLLVRVRSVVSDEPLQLTCRAWRPGRSRSYELVSADWAPHASTRRN
ncbi:MAG TPA: sucrase ferredoxin [Jiangellales bacterium]|nr:sucrase ferredoxin [Jiangellales bacterium]